LTVAWRNLSWGSVKRPERQKTSGVSLVEILVNIDVPDLAPAIEFYSSALGLRLKRRLDADVAELTGASATIYLLLHREGSHPRRHLPATRHYSAHWTPVHLDFVVDDIEKAAAHAEQAGAIRESDCVKWRGSRCMTFSDPFGHGFCLIEFADQTYGDSET